MTENHGRDVYYFRMRNNGKLLCVEFSPESYEWAICHYTKKLFRLEDGIILGAVMAQISESFLCHPLAMEARKRSVRIFQEYEQNCNTCKYLSRVPFDRKYWMSSGLMPGKCLNENREPLYPEGDNILFPPDDCLLQPCHMQR